MVGKKSYPDEK